MARRFHLFLRLHIFLDEVKYGYDHYSYLFFIGGIAAILGGFFGVTGVLAIVLTFIFFYYIGRLHRRMERRKVKVNKQRAESVRRP